MLSNRLIETVCSEITNYRGDDPLLNFHHLHYFWAVAHEENLTRAAQRLHVSQSAVSMQIRKIRGEQRRVLRVGSLATLSRNFQLGFLKPLLRRGDVEIVVRSGAYAEMLRSLEAHLIDVLLVNNAPPRDAATPWVAHAIAEQPVSLVGAPTKKRRTRDLKQLLCSEPLVLPTAESSIRAGFDALVHRLGIRPRIAAEVDDMAMLRLLARERIGLAVVPSIVVRDELQARVLIELAPLPQLKETFFAITLQRRFPNPLLKLLIARGAR